MGRRKAGRILSHYVKEARRNLCYRCIGTLERECLGVRHQHLGAWYGTYDDDMNHRQFHRWGSEYTPPSAWDRFLGRIDRTLLGSAGYQLPYAWQRFN